MAKYLLDTDLLIDDLRGTRFIEDLFAHYFPNDPSIDLNISRITVLELLMGKDGGDENQRYRIFRLIDKFSIVSIDHHIARAAEVVRRRRLKEERLTYKFIPDSIIAATAIENSLVLVSRNRRDFNWLKELNAKFVD